MESGEMKLRFQKGMTSRSMLSRCIMLPCAALRYALEEPTSSAFNSDSGLHGQSGSFSGGGGGKE